MPNSVLIRCNPSEFGKRDAKEIAGFPGKSALTGCPTVRRLGVWAIRVGLPGSPPATPTDCCDLPPGITIKAICIPSSCRERASSQPLLPSRSEVTLFRNERTRQWKLRSLNKPQQLCCRHRSHRRNSDRWLDWLDHRGMQVKLLLPLRSVLTFPLASKPMTVAFFAIDSGAADRALAITSSSVLGDANSPLTTS